MTPILTSEDELDLARLEKELVGALKDHAKSQSKVVKARKKLAEALSKMFIDRSSLNRTMRDVLKQIQMLAREHKSNVKEEDVKNLTDLIEINELCVDANKKYVDVIKELTLRKDYLIEKQVEFADALETVSEKRNNVIKKALEVEKIKNKMVEGDKLKELDQEQKDKQREFDRARDILLKKIEQYNEVREEIEKDLSDKKSILSNPHSYC
ncbi:MAG: hypothetical protein BAJALOKI1v1_210003 [Promethearchaeota archaeon]|nr:MAG: hypothetical protein BAJALOKI1v1_210003 [Candidatus Lokiarchaeota archaeon]